MTVNVTKPQINLRDKLSEVDKPSGIAGEAILRSETPQEVFNYINAGRRNLLINGDFQVSQRGDYSSATSVTGGNYYLDRWTLTTATITPTLIHSSVTLPNGRNVKSQKVTATVAGTGYAQMRQKVEDFLYLRGQWVTISAWVRTNKGDVVNTGLAFYDNGIGWRIGDSIPNDGEWHYVTHTLKVSDTISSYPEITVQHNNSWAVGEYIETALFQLELGKVATPFEYRSYGEELALCQRYYLKTDPNIAAYQLGQGFIRTLVTNGTPVTIQVPYPVMMRTRPDVSVVPGTSNSFQAQVANTSHTASFTANWAASGPNMGWLDFNTDSTSGWNVGDAVSVYPYIPSGHGSLQFSAEL